MKGFDNVPELGEVERCEYIHAHQELVDKVNREMPDEEILYDLAELFKNFWGFHPYQNFVCSV